MKTDRPIEIRATHRLQLHAGHTLADAARIVPYLPRRTVECHAAIGHDEVAVPVVPCLMHTLAGGDAVLGETVWGDTRLALLVPQP